jgi:hypothetical protein
MSSIKQLIVNAIIKVSTTNPVLDREGGPSAEEARDDFIKLLLAELFPEDAAITVPSLPNETVVTVPVLPESPGKKKRAPMTDEAKAAMKAKREATIAAKKAAAGTGTLVPASEESVLEEGEVIPTPPKKARKPKADKPGEDANIKKIDPTWRKHLKHADKDHVKEREPELLAYLNALSKDDFNAKKSEEHVTDFLASRVAAAVESDGKVETDLEVVDFEGKEYYVNPETKRVYEGEGTCDADGNWTNYKGVGYVGMAAFAEMSLDA